jgi:hypothetical protein
MRNYGLLTTETHPSFFSFTGFVHVTTKALLHALCVICQQPSPHGLCLIPEIIESIALMIMTQPSMFQRTDTEAIAQLRSSNTLSALIFLLGCICAVITKECFCTSHHTVRVPIFFLFIILRLLIVTLLAGVVITVSQVITSFRWHGFTISILILILCFQKLIPEEGVRIYLKCNLVTAFGGIQMTNPCLLDIWKNWLKVKAHPGERVGPCARPIGFLDCIICQRRTFSDIWIDWRTRRGRGRKLDISGVISRQFLRMRHHRHIRILIRSIAQFDFSPQSATIARPLPVAMSGISLAIVTRRIFWGIWSSSSRGRTWLTSCSRTTLALSTCICFSCPGFLRASAGSRSCSCVLRMWCLNDRCV